jgi:hypothetical protein
MEQSEITHDDGISLVELLIYSALALVVLAIVGGMLINSVRTESTVRSVTEATTQGQLAAGSLENGVRNSTDFTLTTQPSGDQLLQARVASTSTPVVYRCVAWYYSISTKSLRYRESPTTVAVPTSAQLAGWRLLVSGILPKTGVAAAGPIFAGVEPQLDIDFRVTAGKDPPAAISSSTVRRLTEASSQCS